MTNTKAKARGKARALPVGAEAAAAGSWPGEVALGAWLWLRLRSLAAAESGPGRLFPWIPVAFGLGIALYFTAEHEPVMPVAVATALGLSAAAFVARRGGGVFVALALLAAVASGFATATLRAARLAHVVLDRPISNVTVTGFVETREFRERTDRFVLRVTDIEGARAMPALERVRLSVRKGAAPEVGGHVAFKARLSPPMAPMRPGSYDFARDLYFQGIGASGFVFGAIRARAPEEATRPGWWVRYSALIHSTRDRIDARIRATIDGDNRAIATALLTGRRDAISTPINDAMFISGLGHVLSISGYHMAVVAGAVFFLIRALLALAPRLSAGRPIKKWAAFAALLASAFYLLLSGAEVATQRSFLMTAVVLVGIMLDRRAITFRTLAIAALAVLAWSPESVVHPSFQMSFAATLGLVALVERGLPKFMALPDHWTSARIAHWGAREIAALTMASLIAGLATTPYAAFHFHRVTPYGVLANLAAMPVVSGWIMPAGMLGLAAMPFGLDGPFWRVMELGITWMVAVATWVAALPGATARVSAFGTPALLVMTAGMIAMALMRSNLRWAGGVLIAIGIVWAARAPAPDILISDDLRHVAVRARDGRLRLMSTGKDTFVTREWLAADGDTRGKDDGSRADGVACDASGCVTRDADDRVIALARHASAFADDCGKAALIVARVEPPRDCAARVIDRHEARRRGAMMLRRGGNDFELMGAVRPPGYDRPWAKEIREVREGSGVPGASGAGPGEAMTSEPGSGDARRPPSRAGTGSSATAGSGTRRAPVDATPAPGDIEAGDGDAGD